MAPSLHYRLFGLNIRSDVPLPGVVAIEPAATVDVAIVLGAVPDAMGSEYTPVMVGGAAVLHIPDVARYAVRDGREIRIEPAPDAADRDVCLYLLGSAFGLLLHQRGLLPLHANAIAIDGQAVAFLGHSGAGKSTLASWFHDQGFPVLADDVCVVQFDSDRNPLVTPGLQRLRLWRDALEETGRNPASFPLSFSPAGGREKFDVTLTEEHASEPIPLVAAYLLAKGEEAGIQPLTGVKAAEMLFANTYRGAFLDTTSSHQAHWLACVELVRRTALFEARRGWGFERFDEQNRLLLDHATKQARGPTRNQR